MQPITASALSLAFCRQRRDSCFFFFAFTQAFFLTLYQGRLFWNGCREW